MSDVGLLAGSGRVSSMLDVRRLALRTEHPTSNVEHRTSNIDVSVCIANWNCRDLLRGCLCSLLRQAHDVGLEVIVVDNASTDGAADMVAREFSEVRLIRNGVNRGFSRANNQAAHVARGRHLFFLNNDTVVLPGSLQCLVDYADNHSDVGMIGPRSLDGQGRCLVSVRQRPTMAALLHMTLPLRWTGIFKQAYRSYRRQLLKCSRHAPPDDYPHAEREDYTPAARPVDILMGAAVLLPRWRFFACGSWDEDFMFSGEDMELSARVNRVAKVVYRPQAEIVHFGRVSSRLRIGFAASQLAIGRVRYFRKVGHGRLPLLAYKVLVTIDAPLQLLLKLPQGLWRRLSGRRNAAQRSFLAARGTWHFLTRGLAEFWKA